MFSKLLVNYLERALQLDVKHCDTNATMFVIDKSLYENSRWDDEYFYKHFDNNIHYMYPKILLD